MIKMEDLRRALMCSRGARVFFQAHGLDWDTFLKEGIPAEALEATGDVMALECVRIARDGRRK
ncbi:tail assembly chaperone [Stenotrophomonas phage vB_SmaS_Bhz59]